MSAKTKIVVLQMKEVIYTGIFAALGILLIVLFLYMFLPKEKSDNIETTDTASKYVAGVYSSSIVFNDQALEIEVLVDKDHINSVRLVNLNETVSTMYPLIEPTLESLTTQLLSTQSLDSLTYSEESKYTSQVLIEALRIVLDKAKVKQTETTAPTNTIPESTAKVS